MLHGLGNGGAAVDDLLMRGVSGALTQPSDDVGQYGFRRLMARVVAGDHHVVGQAGRNRAHQRALAAVAVAAAAEHHGQLPATRGGQRAQGLQGFVQGVGRVGVVDHQLRQLLTIAHALHAARHRRHQSGHAGNFGQRVAQSAQATDHGQQIGDVVLTDQAGLQQ